MTLAMLAHTYLAVTAVIAPKSPGSSLIPLRLAEIKRFLADLIVRTPT
ncbi:hypothetical protein [Alloactinosynnema sp. L-07]|nr:hypothetical protein [Alloactinosynnema sp. L-07]